MAYQDLWRNIYTLSLVILAASVCDISCGKTDRQTDRQTDRHINAAENHVTTVGAGNNSRINSQREQLFLS